MFDFQIISFQDDLEDEKYVFCDSTKSNTTSTNNVKTYFRFWGWSSPSPDSKFALITLNMFSNSHITRLNKITLVSRPEVIE